MQKKLSKDELFQQKTQNIKSFIINNNSSAFTENDDEFSLIKNKKNFTVAVRIKPELNSSQNDLIPITISKFHNSQQLKIGSINKSDYHSYTQNNNKKFTFDKVFETSTKNTDIFESLIQKKLKLLQNGVNLSIMAYGATNSGKTYTIFGKNTDNNNIQCSGIASMTLGKVYQMLSNQYSMTFSFVQIYNQNIYDLLNSNSYGRPLNILQDSQGNTNIIGIHKVDIQSISQIQKLINQGNLARISNSNVHNVHSSRSHALMQLQLKHSLTKQRTKLVIVDLAGSQKYIYNNNQINNNGSNLLKQGSNINKSLLSLGNCIKSLHENQNHVPYRDSKLTRLLKENLNGYAHNIMITCIGQKVNNIQENLNSLNYALKAMKIQKKIQRKIQSQQLSQYQCTYCMEKLPYALIKDINKHYEHSRKIKTRQSHSLSISPISKSKDKQNQHFFRSNQAETNKQINSFVSFTQNLIDQKFDMIFKKMTEIQYSSINKLCQLLIKQKQSIKSEIKQKFSPTNNNNNNNNISPFSIGLEIIQNNSAVVSEFQNTINSIDLSSQNIVQQNHSNISKPFNNNNIAQKRVKITLAKPNKRVQRTASTCDNRSILTIPILDNNNNSSNHIRIQQDISQSVSQIHSFRSNLTVNILDDKQKLFNQRKKVLQQTTYNSRSKHNNNSLLQFKSRQSSLKNKNMTHFDFGYQNNLTLNLTQINHNKINDFNVNSNLLDSTSIAPRMKRDQDENIKNTWESIFIKNVQSPDRNIISMEESFVQESIQIKQNQNQNYQQRKFSRVFRY